MEKRFKKSFLAGCPSRDSPVSDSREPIQGSIIAAQHALKARETGVIENQREVVAGQVVWPADTRSAAAQTSIRP